MKTPKKIMKFVIIPLIMMSALIIFITLMIHNTLGLNSIDYLSTLSSVIVIGLFAFVVYCCVYTYYYISDYRRYLYLIMAIPLSILTLGLNLEIFNAKGDQLIAIGFVLQTSLSSLLVILRSAEIWFNKNGIPISIDLGDKKEHLKCPKATVLSVPPNLSQN